MPCDSWQHRACVVPSLRVFPHCFFSSADSLILCLYALLKSKTYIFYKEPLFIGRLRNRIPPFMFEFFIVECGVLYTIGILQNYRMNEKPMSLASLLKVSLFFSSNEISNFIPSKTQTVVLISQDIKGVTTSILVDWPPS